jgi:hypothetical protein
LSKIYLINVGANTQHQSSARSPIFNDDSFVFVSFPTDKESTKPYPMNARPFTHKVGVFNTHADPDWDNLTYGDSHCGRSAALKKAEPGDILLFWALLWRNINRTWKGFTENKGWYLIGALRIEEILRGKQTPEDAKPFNVKRAAENAHINDGVLDDNDLVFIGNQNYSCLFPKAVGFVVDKSESDLLFRTVRMANGTLLKPDSNLWASSTRSCRAVWNLADPEQKIRAEEIRSAILLKTNFDLLRNIS